MKLTIDIDCTPEEARTFLGLPDLKPVHDRLVAALEARTEAGIAAMDPGAVFAGWLKPGLEGFGQFQRAMWQGMAQSAAKGEKE